jgi:hypothetical protein
MEGSTHSRYHTALERQTEVDEHQRLAVPAQAILQEAHQLRVAEGLVLGPICEAIEDVAQAAQSLVDGLRLLEALRVGHSAALVETLGPRKVATLLALRSRRGHSLRRRHERRRGSVGGHEAVAEDQLVLQR